MNGTVKFFNNKKGFGFITGDDEKEYFVHISALAQGTRIKDNDSVSFEGAETDRGLQARNVTLAGEGSSDSGQEQDSQASESSEESAPAEENADSDQDSSEESGEKIEPLE